MWTIDIDYYDGSLPLRRERVDSARWRQDAGDDVVYVYISRNGVRPWGNPDLVYTMRMVGYDRYYVVEDGQGNLRFGGFDDTGHRRDFVWREDGSIETVGPPDLHNRDPKEGVLLPTPDAEEVGLI